MPTYIVKPERERDFYVLWSTVVDNVVGVGDAPALLAAGDAPERLARANQSGTSMLHGDYGWDDKTFLVTNMPEVGFFRLQRSDLTVFALLMVEDRQDEAMRFLTRIEA